MKNGRPLTPAQIRAQQEYVARAKAKKLARKIEAERKVQVRILQAQARALDFERRQAAKHGHPPASGSVYASGSAWGSGFNTAPAPNTSAPTSVNPRIEATLQGTRLIPWQTAQGRPAQMVLIDWTNTGTTPISAVYASITAYSEDGQVLDSGAPDYCVFAVENPSRAIQPGQTYHEPNDEGFILLSSAYGEAKRVTVRILRAKP